MQIPKIKLHRFVFLPAMLILISPAVVAGRVTTSLNGIWEVGESVGAEEMPSAFSHTVPVPGLVSLATPPFPDAGRFDSSLYIAGRVRLKLLEPSAMTEARGVSRQTRNYFWYSTHFRPSERREIAILRIAKAQFGTAVWLNGEKIGEHFGCFTAGFFNLTEAIDWKGENHLVVRLGAHPLAVPEVVPTGTDPSKKYWLPGIYDNVTLILTDNPVIETVQVAPRIATSEVLIETQIRNYGGLRTVALRQQVRSGPAASEKVALKAGEVKVVRQTLKLPGAILWSPETPHLYQVVTSTGGDDLLTRFGMRELRFDTTTRRAYLNGKPYFLRGSNIALHRFLEDPKAARLPWDEKWVRKLMGEIPKRMHWNSIRFHVGPPPEMWLDIADEEGVLVFNEFYIFKFRDEWGTAELTEEYKEWMRDQWNHPSVGLWDASNETLNDRLPQIITAVRGVDLSNRSWDNGYNLPVGPDDPVEHHPYLFINKAFNMADLEKMTGATDSRPNPTGHAVIINEYDWLWLQRDGSPTDGTRETWSKLLPGDSTPGERFALQAYLVAGLTEFWRAHRAAAGVIHFCFLSYSVPYSNSSGNFSDIESLTLEPHFEDYVKEAFKPLGVYINFWQPSLKANTNHRLAVMMVNDAERPATGRLVVSLTDENGTEVAKREIPFSIPALGQQTYAVDLGIPAFTGKCVLQAAAYSEANPEPTRSRRHIAVRED